MKPNQREASARRFSNDCWHILELSTGELALLNEARNIVMIDKDWTKVLVAYRGRQTETVKTAVVVRRRTELDSIKVEIDI